MAVFAGPKIIDTSLVMHVNATNSASYPGSGNTWFDISGQNNHLTLYNSPVFSNGVVQFNGTTQHADNNLNLSTGASTVIAASRYSGAIRGRTITSKNNNWLMGHYGSPNTQSYYAEGWVTAGGPNDTSWRIYAGTSDTVSDTYSFYVNGVIIASNSSGVAGPNGISLAAYAGTNERSTCEVSFVLVYNRVLSPAEIQLNFEATRGRIGI